MTKRMLLPSISTVSVSSSRQLQATALWNGRFQVRVTGVRAFSLSYRRRITPSPSSASLTVSSTTFGASTEARPTASPAVPPATASIGWLRK